ncbi:unnamed protein product [Closterium sp. NIES-64]|nr:unnamed protein product [Closterium sp. NIES-64]
MASLHPPIRFLTFEWLDGCGGFADVLAGLVTAFVAAVLDNRALIIRNDCLPAAFEPNMINWTPGPFVPLEPARKLALVEDSEGRTVPERARDGEVVWLWLRNKFVKIEPFFRELEGAVNVRMTSNRGVLTWLQMKGEGEWAERFKAMGMRLPYALGCSLRFLMRPKPEVQALFQSIEQRLRRRPWVARGGLRRPRVATVGIHIRVNDSVVWAGDRGKPKELTADQVDVLLAHARKWILCARRVEEFWFPSSVLVRWMLVTNSAQLKAAIKSRIPPSPDLLLALQHPPVVTIGKRQAIGASHIIAGDDELAARGVEVHRTARGGDATFHGPGQAVLYPVLRLPDLRLGARRYVEGLEDVMVRGSARFGVEARGRVPGMTGVWVGWDEEGSDGECAGFDGSGGISGGVSNTTSEGGSGRKIGAVGVQISGVTDVLIEEFVREFGFEEERCYDEQKWLR